MQMLKFLVLVLWSVVNESLGKTYHDYCVIGAGPGGLQFSYFLERAGRDYVTFEKGPTAGTFYTKYPIHRYLISINKRNTGKTNKEFNLRHDWNSIISDNDDLLITKYSKDFFPAADVLVQYLKDYAETLKLKIQYNTTISNLKPRDETDKLFHVNDQHGTEYTCKTVIVATGIAKPNFIEFPGSEHVIDYKDLSIDKEDFEGKSVLILGKGNSAFETAQHIMSATNVIHFLSKSRVKLAWETHYVGDVRAVNNGPLDTYQLKSLDGVVEGDVRDIEMRRSPIDGKFHIVFNETSLGPVGEKIDTYDQGAMRRGYDSIISCLGFKFDQSILESNESMDYVEGGKYPYITYQYESLQMRGVYFAGTNTHSLDFRKSAGGFIHGFRYSARTLHRILENKIEGNPWPSVKFNNLIDAIPHLMKRLNEASDIYQMFSVLCEVMILGEDKSVTYLEAYPCALISRLQIVSGHNVTGGVIFTALEYGTNFSGPGSDPFRDGRIFDISRLAHKTNFLHPNIYYYEKLPTDGEYFTRPTKWILPIPDKMHYVASDLTTVFDAPRYHITHVRRFFEYLYQKDFRQLFAEQCMLAAFTHRFVPESCKVFDNNNRGVEASADMKKHLNAGAMRTQYTSMYYQHKNEVNLNKMNV